MSWAPSSGAMRQRIGHMQHADRGTLFLDEIETLPWKPRASSCGFWRSARSRLWAATPSTAWTCASSRPPSPTWPRRRRGRRSARTCSIAWTSCASASRRCASAATTCPLLFAHFLARACERLRADAGDRRRRALAAASHDWPGNVRELSHFAQRVVLGLDETVGESAMGEAPPLPARVAAYEADLIKEILGQCHGDVRSALAVLGIPRKTFYDKLERYGIDINRFRER
jgi:two-component system C4-dicarboxylate transport response regulator DctD